MAQRCWTTKQLQSITARGGSVLVSAAAGSGKTAVLVERVIQRITDTQHPVDINRLLIVTYTRAAAAEMRQRLSAALSEKIAAEPDNIHYQRQQMLLPQARISTIHGFCAGLLREQAGRAGLPIGFRVAEEAQTNLLSVQALEEVLEESYRRRESAFLSLAFQLNSQRDDRGLREAVKTAYDFMQAQPFPERWLRNQIDAYTAVCPLEKTAWIAPLLREVCFLLHGAIHFTDLALDAASEGLDVYRDVLKLDRLQLKSLLATIQPENEADRCGYADMVAALSGFSFARLPAARGKDTALQEGKERVKALREKVKKRVTKAKELLSNEDEAACRLDLAAMAPLVEALGDLVGRYTARFKQLKRKQRLLDYGDLEHECLRLLLDAETGQRTPLAVQLAETFDEIMVDEYQDTNAAQDALFQALSRQGENLFMVGDVKQSIYGFRQAMPEIFTRRRTSAAAFDPSAPQYPACITLENNFRSREQVTDTVNFLFRQVMQPALGGVSYDQQEALVCSVSYPPCDTADTEWLLIDQEQSESSVSLETAEVVAIAERIQQLMEEMTVKDGDGVRPLAYRDICILLRQRKHIRLFAKELNRLGIPIGAEGSDSLLSSVEVQTVLSLLRIVDNPLRDVEWAAVMLSPLYGFTPDALAHIRLMGGKKTPLYTALGQVAANSQEPLADLCKGLLQDVARLRTLAVSLPADRLLERIYREMGIEALFSACPGGRQKVANLYQLDRVARQFEQGGFRGLSAFMRYVDRLEEQGKDLPAGNTASQDGVRLMTVHGSKGLEFPVVILARLNVQMSQEDRKARLLFHATAGIGLQLRDEKENTKHSTLPFAGVKSARLQDGRAEDLRVWYVALTRAKEKLILVYTTRCLQKQLAALEEALPIDTRLSPDGVLYANSPGEWMLMAALRHPDFLPFRQSPSRTRSLSANTAWRVEVLTPRDKEDAAIDSSHVDTASPDDAVSAALRERLAYTYTYAPLGAVPAKLAASQLSHEAMSRQYIAQKRPAFLQKEGMTATQRGTALHTFMQFADYARAATDLMGEIERLVQADFLTQRQATALPTEKINRFFAGAVYARMAASPDCRREYSFAVTVPAGELTPLQPPLDAEPVLVQGIADCVFREGDGLVLLDYKTDHVKESAELVQRYRQQMLFYSRALETLLGLPVKEALLYSFHLDCGVTVDITEKQA